MTLIEILSKQMDVRLKFRQEVWAGLVELKDTNKQLLFKCMRLDEMNTFLLLG